MNQTTADTPASKIERWQALKAHLAEQFKAFSAYCKPFKDEQEGIEAWLLNFLNETKQDSARTEYGTAYKSTLTLPKIVDRDTYLDFCLDNWDDGGNEMLQLSAPQVDAFKKYIEERTSLLEQLVQQGQRPNDLSVTPPGTSVEYMTRVNVRKA